ncbi:MULTISPECIES: thiamine pyrophosphate-binding protein [Streptomyces]|uniref:thiamine pyrophosphate-binding protein n=1 Tax=Streptomyces TaxID=1883 RepID=UPI00196468B9|nr:MULTISPECIES: thiamine pyrophosphate-binding protein [Streptomyces]QRX94985.1 thiamine pyrophosphate-binding protein [Streptomyces noursei]UJB46181.1 thiamine pyrophosphate-binding protein [Streptomyces sp. A1-5]
MTSHSHPTAWAAVADHVRHLGVGAVFGLPGDDMDLLGALEQSTTEVVLCRDQRHAVHMATGYALASGRLAVCAVGKGPALTNTLTGLLEARSAAAPVILLAGGTGLDRLGTGAFQELDQLAAVRPFTKWAVRVDHSERLPAALDKAALIAVNGTPGPVYVEIAEQIAQEPVTVPAPWRPATPQRLPPDPQALRAAADLISAAHRPLLLVGGGARHRNTDRSVERLADLLGAGMFCTASGRGTLREDHPLFCGVSGLYTVAPATELWRDADLVIALGSRLEETATFGWPEHPDRPVIQVVSAEDSAVTDRPGVCLLGDVHHAVSGWTELLGGHQRPAQWAGRVREVRAGLHEHAVRRAAKAAAAVRPAGEGGATVAEVLAAVDRAVPADRVLVQENGLQDMWSYFFPHWSCGAQGGSVVPSEQTPLGFGAAAAVGVQLALPGRAVVAVVGDGAFNVFRGELPTVADSGAPVLYIVLDNGGYGWLQTNLDRVCGEDSRFAFTAARPTGTEGIARAYGLGHWRVEDRGDLDRAVAEAWRHCASGSAAVVEVRVRLTDTPPGIDEPAGDFPLREDS